METIKLPVPDSLLIAHNINPMDSQAYITLPTQATASRVTLDGNYCEVLELSLDDMHRTKEEWYIETDKKVVSEAIADLQKMLDELVQLCSNS